MYIILSPLLVAPLDGDDLEMIKYPPDSESFVTGVSPYSRQVSMSNNLWRQFPVIIS